MSQIEREFHETWLGMVQPGEGLVVSPSVLTEAQCMCRLPKTVQQRLADLCDRDKNGPRLRSLPDLFQHLLGIKPSLFDTAQALPDALCLYVPEGQQILRPTSALRTPSDIERAVAGETASAAERAGASYCLLVWEVPTRLQLDKPETQTGPWEYPAIAKFDRLLRECHVPIGLLTNGVELRLVYAPSDSASGWVAFRLPDMLQSDGREILDAFVMLLSGQRWFGGRAERQLPALLRQSRQQQAEVTGELAEQVFEALQILLSGFQAAADRDGDQRLYEAVVDEEDKVYAGLLTVLLRVVFLLYCEDHRLLPMDHGLFSEHYSVLGLFEQLQEDADQFPDSMHLRLGAYARLVSLFRAVYMGGKHGTLDLPERRGDLFDPSEYPFLEGWGPGGSAPIVSAERRQAVRLPSVDDGTIYQVLERLLVLKGQRLSYRSLNVEQIGGVYEALMGFGVERLRSGAVCIKLGSKKGAARVWVEAFELLQQSTSQKRESWLKAELGFDNAMAKKIATGLKRCSDEVAILVALEAFSRRPPERASAGTLVLQPRAERRRTSSHFTPKELAKQVVDRALEPLIRTMGGAPKSESLLNLVVCDPAMGSGAFLVAACEYLADQLIAAWTREGKTELLGNADEDVRLYAKRVVAQRCLLGVDKNRYAVQLARISLWLATMSRHEPFTFVDHSLRHGDSLVGLDLKQLRSFHWRPENQLELLHAPLKEAVDEAVEKRQRILDLARKPGTRTSEKERLLFQAQDALADLILIGDVLVGAFFAHERSAQREAERKDRRDLVVNWLGASDDEQRATLRAQLAVMQLDLRRTETPFHWMLEYPEVFCDERLDPLDGGRPNSAAWVDSFIGNPPFMGGKRISTELGKIYPEWLVVAEGGGKNVDISARFFCRCRALLGRHGTLGLITTKSIAEGDTRAAGLQKLVNDGLVIYSAILGVKWPGPASVTVDLVHIATGAPMSHVSPELDGVPVGWISSRLRPERERMDPVRLARNTGCAFIGTYVRGVEAFCLQPEQRDALVAAHHHNADRILPYLGGEEVNTSPTQSHDRFVINFGHMSLEDCGRWPELLETVRVRSERHKVEEVDHRTYWWMYANRRDELYATLEGLGRCLVAARVSQHLCVSFKETANIFSEQLCVFGLDAYTHFAVLQSRIHEVWARMLSSTMGTGLRYTPTECFATFPFPEREPRTALPELETIGRELYQTRARFMVDTRQGLTKTYNSIKEPECGDARIVELRSLHQQLDQAVLAAYEWADIPVPPYCPVTGDDHRAVQAFEDEIIDRLFVLNTQRAEEEALGGAFADARKKQGEKKIASSSPSVVKTQSGKTSAANDGASAPASSRPIVKAGSRRASSKDTSEPPPTSRKRRGVA